MKYREIKGDLFKVNPNIWALAHCISADVSSSKNMNKGIAKLFRKKYPEMAGKISPKLQVGKALRYQKDNHVIYNLVTKEKVWQKAKGNYRENYYRQLKNSLIHMKQQMLMNQDKFLAMPKIASGLDGGNWIRIREMIKVVFNETEIEIQIRFIDEPIQIGYAKYLVEKAKSGRSKCTSCGKSIEKNSLRLKEGIPTRNYVKNQYYCKSCASEKLDQMRDKIGTLLEGFQN